MTKQPTALRLADVLERFYKEAEARVLLDAADELRRLHAENGRLLQANLDEHEHFDALMADYIQQSSINAQLLEALESLYSATLDYCGLDYIPTKNARAAIEAARGIGGEA